jgi:hypothetical protein
LCPDTGPRAEVMFILVLEFLALVIICYVFFVYATRKRVAENKGKLAPAKVIGVIILVLFAFILFASWYVRLGLNS